MTTVEKIEKLALLTDNALPMEVLSLFLDIAKNKVLNRIYPFGTPDDVGDVPLKYEHIELSVAVYLVNKMGAEGETSHSENGVSRVYENADVPNSMLDEIVPKAGLIV